MNTPIVKISDDQNEITHESGVVTVFVENGRCVNCCYYPYSKSKKTSCCNKIPCHTEIGKIIRENNYGIFKLKQQTT